MRGQKIRAKLQALLLAACMGVCSLQVTTASAAEEKPKSVDIVFTHDTHSHLNSFRTVGRWRKCGSRRICTNQNSH